jgi:signal peptidase II
MPGEDRKRNQAVIYFFVLSVALVIFVADFFIKRYFLVHPHPQSTPVIKNILYLTVVYNKGAAFGLLRGQTALLIYLGIIFLTIFVSSIWKEKRKDPIFLFACGLILGGALSNMYDRLILGYVVDYIDVRIWPVFNLSDSSISVGAFLLFLDSFKKSNGTPHRHARGT